MSGVRRLASKLLDMVVRRLPQDSQGWGNAMLRELDFIDGDWAAILWAIGSTAAIFKHSLPRIMKAWADNQAARCRGRIPKGVRKSAAGLASGMIISTGVLAACVFGLSRLSSVLSAEWRLNQAPWADWLAWLGIPETIFVVAAIVLWGKRRTTAAGILVGALILITHAIMHAASHG